MTNKKLGLLLLPLVPLSAIGAVEIVQRLMSSPEPTPVCAKPPAPPPARPLLLNG